MSSPLNSQPLKIEPLFDSLSLDRSDPLWPILAASLSKKSVQLDHADSSMDYFWTPEHFGLHRVGVFKEASEGEQRNILRMCAARLLEEAFSIEQLGLCFNAKMILLSETSKERMLYSLFAADEAAHFYSIASYLPKGRSHSPDQPFLLLLKEVIERGDKLCLIYLIQVVLEGWGISHYSSITHDCQSPRLKQALTQIVKDETLHHGSGVVLFNQQILSEADKQFTLEILARLFQMVQAGPQAVVSCLERAKGHLSRGQKIRVFRELECETQSRQRIETLQSLIGKGQSGSLLEMLKQYDVFRPFSPEECVGRPSASGIRGERQRC